MTPFDVVFFVLLGFFVFGLVMLGRSYRISPSGGRRNMLLSSLSEGVKKGLLLAVVLSAGFLIYYFASGQGH